MPVASNSFHFGFLSQNAGAAIVRCIPYRKNRLARITSMRYTCVGSAAHILGTLPALGSTTLAANASPGASSVTLTADPAGNYGPPVNGDYLTFVKPDGVTFVAKVLLWNAGTMVVTLASLLPETGLEAGDFAFFHGQVSDHLDRRLNAPAGQVTSWNDELAGVAEGLPDQPLLIVSTNGAGTGSQGSSYSGGAGTGSTLEYVNGIYTER